MKRFALLLSLLISVATYAQKEDNPAFKDRLFFGGDIALSFSSNTAIVGAAPLVGCRITDRWAAGVGVSYYYFRSSFFGQDYATSIFGGNAFTRVLITDALFAQTELNIINTDIYTYNPTTDTVERGRGNIPMWYVGGGYRQNIGGNAFASVTVLYDLIDDLNSPYQNPIIRGGVSLGF